jgi:hypothetical protein
LIDYHTGFLSGTTGREIEWNGIEFKRMMVSSCIKLNDTIEYFIPWTDICIYYLYDLVIGNGKKNTNRFICRRECLAAEPRELLKRRVQ